MKKKKSTGPLGPGFSFSPQKVRVYASWDKPLSIPGEKMSINFSGASSQGAESAGKCSEDLYVIDVDLRRGVVKIGCKADSFENKLSQLNSQDVLTMAVIESTKAGMLNPMIKDKVVMYGDAETGVPNSKPLQPIDAEGKTAGEWAPFLAVTMHSSTVNDTTYHGDSL